MRLIPRSLKWRTILLTLVGLLGVGVSVWYTFRADIAAFVKRQSNLDRMRKSKSPVDQMIGRGELRERASVTELADAHPPANHFRFGEYEVLKYDMKWVREDLYVIAQNGRVVYAGTECGGERGYVGGMSPDEQARFRASVLRATQNQMLARAAVVGVAGVAASGVSDPGHFPPTDEP